MEKLRIPDYRSSSVTSLNSSAAGLRCPLRRPCRGVPDSSRFNSNTTRVLRVHSYLHRPPPPTGDAKSASDCKPGFLDNMLMSLFRSKLVQEVGWDSEKPGYDGMIEVANHLMMKGKNNIEIEKSAVRVLRSLFPPLLLDLFKMLIAPMGGGQVAAMMIARATVLSCQWLMGRCYVNSVNLPDGSICSSGVLVEKCSYLEKSKCAGICIKTCKMPSQKFFMEYMGVPLLMEPNFDDYSCQFKFGVPALPPGEDKSLFQSCLDICPNASRRREIHEKVEPAPCPKV